MGVRDSSIEPGSGAKRQVIGYRQALNTTVIATDGNQSYPGNELVKAKGRIVAFRMGGMQVPVTATQLHVFPYKLDQSLADPFVVTNGYSKARIPILPSYAAGLLPSADTLPTAGVNGKVYEQAIPLPSAIVGSADAGGAASITLTGAGSAYIAVNQTNGAHPGGANNLLTIGTFTGIDDSLNGMLYVQKADSGATLRGFAAIIADYADTGNVATLDRLAQSAIGAVASIVYTAPLNKPCGWCVGGDIEIVAGVAAAVGQKRKIISLEPETMVATVTPAWATQPVDGDIWKITPKNNLVNAGDAIIFEVWAAGASTVTGSFAEVVIEFDERDS